MGTIVEFLLDHYFLMVTIIIVVILAIIGYMVESSKKGKEQPASQNTGSTEIPLVESVNLNTVSEAKRESTPNVNSPSPIELGTPKPAEQSPIELAKK